MLQQHRTGMWANTNNGSWVPGTFVGRLQAVEQKALLALGRPVIRPEGEHLVVQGEHSRFVLVLHGGPVKVVVYDTSGREQVLGLRGRGDLLGELSYLDYRPRSASVVTLCPTEVTTIAAVPFGRFLEEYPHARLELTRYVAARLRDADRARVEIATDHATLRVARLLYTLALGYRMEPTQRQASILLTQGQLAQLAHGAEVTLNRVLRDFRERDLVRTGYGSVDIPCLPCLYRFVTVLVTEQDDAKSIMGCGGRDPHDEE